jgi:hypothetical protein
MRTVVQMEPVEGSSSIRAIGMQVSPWLNTGELHVEFTNGRLYRYRDISLGDLVELFTVEDSFGSAFARLIRQKYKGDEIEFFTGCLLGD